MYMHTENKTVHLQHTSKEKTKQSNKRKTTTKQTKHKKVAYYIDPRTDNVLHHFCIIFNFLSQKKNNIIIAYNYL